MENIHHNIHSQLVIYIYVYKHLFSTLYTSITINHKPLESKNPLSADSAFEFELARTLKIMRFNLQKLNIWAPHSLKPLLKQNPHVRMRFSKKRSPFIVSAELRQYATRLSHMGPWTTQSSHLGLGWVPCIRVRVPMIQLVYDQVRVASGDN